MVSKRLSLALWRKLDSHNISSFKRLSEHLDLNILCISSQKESNLLFDSSRNSLDLQVVTLPLTSLVTRVLQVILDSRKTRPLVLFHHGYHRPWFVLLALVNSITGGINILCFDICYERKFSQFCGVFAFRLVLSKIYDLAYVAGSKSSEYASMLGFNQARIYTGLFDVHPYLQNHFRTYPKAFFTSPSNRIIKFLFVGRLVPSKGFDLLLRAWSDLVSDQVFAANQLIVCGGGPLEEIVDSDICDFRGYVNPNMLGDIFSEVDCLISPSRYDPFGACLLEAAFFGLPIICSSLVGAAHDFVDHKVNGYVIDKLNVENIQQALHYVNKSFLNGSLGRMRNESLLKYQSYSHQGALFVNHLLSLL